jgi:hypothetical protein
MPTPTTATWPPSPTPPAEQSIILLITYQEYEVCITYKGDSNMVKSVKLRWLPYGVRMLMLCIAFFFPYPSNGNSLIADSWDIQTPEDLVVYAKDPLTITFVLVFETSLLLLLARTYEVSHEGLTVRWMGLFRHCFSWKQLKLYGVYSENKTKATKDSDYTICFSTHRVKPEDSKNFFRVFSFFSIPYSPEAYQVCRAFCACMTDPLPEGVNTQARRLELTDEAFYDLEKRCKKTRRRLCVGIPLLSAALIFPMYILLFRMFFGDSYVLWIGTSVVYLFACTGLFYPFLKKYFERKEKTESDFLCACATRLSHDMERDTQSD